MKNKKVIFILALVIIVTVSVCIIIFSGEDEINNNKNEESNGTMLDGTGNAPSKIEPNEKNVSDSIARELYEFIPKVYHEQMAPFSSVFMMDAAMNKIIEASEDFSAKNVDKYVKEIFGKEAKIDKEEVSTPDISKSIFYYSQETDSYEVIPVGYGGIFKMQIFKNATETEEAYYVYTYALNGIYYNDDEAIVESDSDMEDEFFEEDFNEPLNPDSKIKVVVGDKEGYDLIHMFDSEKDIYDEKIWTENYENNMPIFRYTIKKDGRTYYLVEVEQITY